MLVKSFDSGLLSAVMIAAAALISPAMASSGASQTDAAVKLFDRFALLDMTGAVDARADTAHGVLRLAQARPAPRVAAPPRPPQVRAAPLPAPQQAPPAPAPRPPAR